MIGGGGRLYGVNACDDGSGDVGAFKVLPLTRELVADLRALLAMAGDVAREHSTVTAVTVDDRFGFWCDARRALPGLSALDPRLLADAASGLGGALRESLDVGSWEVVAIDGFPEYGNFDVVCRHATARRVRLADEDVFVLEFDAVDGENGFRARVATDVILPRELEAWDEALTAAGDRGEGSGDDDA